MDHTAIETKSFSARSVLIYALAAAGAVIGYLPLLTLLLPLKVEALAATDRYGLLATCSIVGALVAGMANIAFGWLGDRSVARGRGRRGWLGWGLLGTALSSGGVVAADGAAAIVAAIVLFQVAINAVLVQIGALIAEEIPADRKSTAAALLTLGNPLAAGVSAVVVAASTEAARSVIVVALTAACILPLMLIPARPMPATRPSDAARLALRRDLAVAWAARLLMQVAGSSVGLYLLFYFERLAADGAEVPAAVARLLFAASVVPVPIAFLLGRWSDRSGRRTPVLAATAIIAAVGLIGMAAASSWMVGAASYVAFASGVAIFVALNTGHVMLLLPDSGRRGRDLGILNLANTIPQLVAPVLAWWSATAHGFAAALSVLAVLTLLAGLLPVVVGDRRR